MLLELDSVPVSPSGIVAILLLAFVARTIWNRYFHGLNAVPGPFLASITDFWRYSIVLRQKMPSTNTQLHEKYGSLVRIGPTHVSAASPEAVHIIHRTGVGFVKSPVYSLLQPQLGGGPLHNVFSTQDSSFHGQLKRNIGGLYSMASATNFEFYVDATLDAFMSRLDGFAGPPVPQVIDMGAWLQYYVLDSLTAINFSETLGALEKGADVDGICAVSHYHMSYFGLMGQIQGVEKWWSKLKSCFETQHPHPLVTFTINCVQKRQEKPTDSKDMLNAFLEIHKEKPEKFGIRDVIAATYINVVTSHDVLAITLRATLYHICKNPSIRQRLFAEIMDADKAGRFSTPVKHSETLPLTYLTAVIDETLRLHPSTGLILERVVPKRGVVIEGVPIAAGTTIGVNAWVMNRSEDIFGPDVESFRPERWIDDENGTQADRIKDMQRNMFTFGAGPRYCIGKNYAMVQMNKVIVELIRNFDFELAEPDKEWEVAGGWLTTQTGLDMKLTSRKRSGSGRME